MLNTMAKAKVYAAKVYAKAKPAKLAARKKAARRIRKKVVKGIPYGYGYGVKA